VGDLRALWAARSVAVVGASTRPGTPGRLAVEFLQRYGYPGRILPVHPTAPQIAGLPAYPSVAAGGGAELALILVPAPAVAAAVESCAAAGVRVAIVGTAGFAETGSEGRAAQDDLAARARAAGMRLVGPNCIGAAGFGTGQVASFSPMFSGEQTRLIPGGIGFASASGALGFGAVSLALERGMGLHAAVSTGNEADVTALEVLAALAAECSVLLGYLESLRDGAALRALADAGRPTALLVAGRSSAGARAAVSHTGVLATPDRVVDGALRQLGIVRVSDVDELLDVGDALASYPARRPGPRVAVVTTSGGAGILAADAIEAHGLSLARLAPSTVDVLKGIVPPYGVTTNPVDVTATVMRDRTLVRRALAAVAADPGVDAIVVCFCVLTGEDVDAIVAALSLVDKPVLVSRTGADHLAPGAGAALRAAGVPSYPTPARAVRAAAALCQARPRIGIAEAPAAAASEPPAAAASIAAGAASIGAGAVEPDVKRWLARAGVRVPAGRMVHTASEAEVAVRAHGEPAVLKVVVPGLAHKTEAGGVVLGVTVGTAAAAYERLAGISGSRGVLVEQQLGSGVELLVGIAGTPLGPALTVGAGGVDTEALDDVAVRLLPVAEPDVRDALGQTRVSRLLVAGRGRAAPDVDAAVELILRVAGLAGELPAGTALDLNPVLVNESGAVVLDAALVKEP
jgi:acyl-CoA synthetase (NDP forming)